MESLLILPRLQPGDAAALLIETISMVAIHRSASDPNLKVGENETSSLNAGKKVVTESHQLTRGSL